MIKKYCDICKREIDRYADNTYPTFAIREFNVDLCEDCQVKWQTFKVGVQKKYDKLFDDLRNQEMKEIKDFLGLPVDEDLPRTMEIIDE